jgi:pimeloyl-ACP methyl ester carboxylesterase
MRVVVTVHGIGAEAKWQDQIGALFKPHFDYHAIKYPQYRRLGALKLIFDPLVLAAAGVSLSILYWMGYSLTGGQALLTAVLILTASHAAARLRREQAMREFKRQLDEALKGGRQPHLIAHSFGSYLAGRALRRYPDIRFDYVIFAGSVLSSKYNWEPICRGNQPFRQLRNEIARRDLPSRMAYFLEGLVPGMGHSGFRGFRGPEYVVHTVSGPYESCQLCRACTSVARVHNILNQALSHSDHVFSIGYAERFWLPYLWGFNPERYSRFLSICEIYLKTKCNHE